MASCDICAVVELLVYIRIGLHKCKKKQSLKTKVIGDVLVHLKRLKSSFN